MSYDFFQGILSTLGKKLNYDAAVNYAGNSYVEKAWEIIQDNNPMKATTDSHDRSGLEKAISSMGIGDIQIIA